VGDKIEQIHSCVYPQGLLYFYDSFPSAQDKYMQVAISAESTTLKAPVGKRFGISPYLIIIDLETGEWEAVRNPGSSGKRGGGVEAIVFILSKGVKAVLTGYCSPSAKKHLESNGVDVFAGLRGTVVDAIEIYKKGKIKKTKELTFDVLNRWNFLRPIPMADAFKRTGNQFAAMLPILLGVVLLLGLFNTLVPEELLVSIFSGNAILDTLWGACLGSIITGNAVNSYVIGGELLKQGVSLFAVTALIITWVTVGLVQLPAEMEALGRRFGLVRNAVCFILSIPIVLMTVVILNVVTG
jgi:predicted Fe-Mo cluster-binding NifX family protein